MNRSTRLWLFVTPAALAVGTVATALTLLSDHQDLPPPQALLTALPGGSFVAAALLARTRRPDNRTGLLMIAVGFTWFVGAGLVASNQSLPWTIGVALSAIPAGFLIHLLIAYPSGRLQSRWELAVVVTGYVLVTVVHFAHLPVDPDPLSCADSGCPSNAFLVQNDQALTNVAVSEIQVLAVVYLLAVCATLVGRWRHSSPATPGDSASSFVPAGVPFVFLWGLLQSRLARADISSALAEEPRGRLPEELQ